MKIVGHTSMKTHLRYMHLIGKDLHDIVDDYPINKLPIDKWIEDEPLRIPYILKQKERQVN